MPRSTDWASVKLVPSIWYLVFNTGNRTKIINAKVKIFIIDAKCFIQST